MSENNKEQDFVDRVSIHRNRRKLTIISQSPNEMIVDVERADSATINGSIISADTLNDFQDEIDTANSYASSAFSTANSANTTAQTASTAANSANQTATSADTKATTALSNSQTAVTTANEAKAKALEVESKLADRGATIKINGTSQTEINFTSDPQTQISNEVTARTNADNNLQTQITNEATARQNTDSSLQAQINAKLNSADLLNSIYPIGSIYMSANNISPANFIGGTWESIQDRFLLGAGLTYSGGAVGGEASHILTINEMPSHTHTQKEHNHTQQPHTHQYEYDNNNNSSGDYFALRSGKEGIGNTKIISTTALNNGTTALNENTGGGQAHNNMPPYLAVYMWKRTA